MEFDRRHPGPHSGPTLPSESVDRTHFESLLRSRRFADALQALYDVRRPDVEDPVLARSIALLEAKMVGVYEKELGNLALSPRPLLERKAWSELELGEIERRLLEQLASGLSYREVLHRSPLDEHATLRAFVSFVQRGLLERPASILQLHSEVSDTSAYIERARALEGYVGAGVVDTVQKKLLDGDGLDPARLEGLAVSCSDLVRAALRANATSESPASFDELTLCLGSEVQLIRPVSEASKQVIFLVLRRASANVAFARLQMRKWVGASSSWSSPAPSRASSGSMPCAGPYTDVMVVASA
ncbi:MAG TPA: hypothetical protein VF989_08160 [Polyangiaceae bacterium]